MATPPDITIRLEGLDEVKKNLRKAGDGLQKDLTKAGKASADLVAQEAKTRIPVLTGRARASVRAVVSGSGAAVKGGGAKAPWYPWLDFGGHVGRNDSVARTILREGRYIYPSFVKKHSAVVDAYSAQVGEILHEANLT